jgi:hypothetical protein
MKIKFEKKKTNKNAYIHKEMRRCKEEIDESDI